jgi:general secretion pathway protein H
MAPMASPAAKPTTPTSVPGNNVSRAAPFRYAKLNARRCAEGFTLLEMLVVLLIAGVLISAASLSATRNPRTDLNEEGQRLALLFESASDEAQVRSRPIAWQTTKGGYRFAERTDGEWRPLRDDLLGPRHWDIPVTGVGIHYAGSDAEPSQVEFGVESIDQPVVVTLYSSIGQVSVVGTGNGRYEAR